MNRRKISSGPSPGSAAQSIAGRGRGRAGRARGRGRAKGKGQRTVAGAGAGAAEAAACSTHQANLLKEEGPRAMRAWFCHFCVTALARCFDESEALLADGEVSMGESVIRFGGALTFGPPRI
ncbi:hypothetical protein AXG93_1335s1260 [Marchantia polymorpha subsp. ruderalis]|uniref:Uncharacterized protein n=1 Tax=Marchantia polymorpha subsp. ruderalis TaxID=1480154 RepID=A0A176W6L9_MARPO|nr:hypothetical protein AXG93_1335s1260 [Marchantia polymorpha subsp. ruderalis]